ncbi:hypothetical protein [Frankia sp. Cj3]|uniref:hypothetical protein n=1 Tax=Frankia sp. Cj3 TaxID=2880976 RepID=UPI001EF5546E|nr:hypothetical protein [Frankia sp. Cj3]
MHLLLNLGDPPFQLPAFGERFGAAFVDVPDELRVGRLGHLQAADQPLPLVLGLGQRLAQGTQPPVAFPLPAGDEPVQLGTEEITPVVAEDTLREETAETGKQRLLPDPETGDGWMSRRVVALLRRTHVVRGVPDGLPQHPPPTQRAEQVAAQPVHPPALRMPVHPRRGTRPFLAQTHLLGQHERLQIDQRLMHRHR